MGKTLCCKHAGLIAQKFGLDTKNHIAIKFVTLTPNVTAQTLSKGSVDILAAPSVEEATLQGASFKIIAGAALSYWHFVAKKDVASWSDLAGKKVGSRVMLVTPPALAYGSQAQTGIPANSTLVFSLDILAVL